MSRLTENKYKRRIIGASVIAILVVIIAVSIISMNKRCGVGHGHKFRIGHTGSPLLSALYAAGKQSGWNENFLSVKFGTSADVGYALISGEIDAGFVEPSKALIIKKLPEFKNIEVIGKITYPYGAILVVRRGLYLRMQDLEGHTIAASEPSCNLVHAFRKDLQWLKVDPAKIKFEYMPFEVMIPALEAGKIDAAVIKGSYAVLAEKLGYTIPYLQWEVTAGDKCCPAILAQTEFLLLAKREKKTIAEGLARKLLEAEKLPEAQIKTATAEATGIPINILNALPPGSFSFADAALLKLFEEHAQEK
jgi:ABC-type nitrate/sulfonate/bicarbonate transport system substrate-binding protein